MKKSLQYILLIPFFLGSCIAMAQTLNNKVPLMDPADRALLEQREALPISSTFYGDENSNQQVLHVPLGTKFQISLTIPDDYTTRDNSGNVEYHSAFWNPVGDPNKSAPIQYFSDEDSIKDKDGNPIDLSQFYVPLNGTVHPAEWQTGLVQSFCFTANKVSPDQKPYNVYFQLRSTHFDTSVKQYRTDSTPPTLIKWSVIIDPASK